MSDDPFADAIPNAIRFHQMGWGIVPAYSPRLDQPKREDGLHPCSCGKGYVCKTPGKHPAVPKDPTNKDGFKPYFLTDEDSIRTSLSNPGTRNYGLVPPPGVVLIDLDGDGLVRWNDTRKRIGTPGPTLTFKTANGLHAAYEVADDPGGNLLGIITRRHPGGLVIGPGSVHPSGVPYAYAADKPVGHLNGVWGIEFNSFSRQTPKTVDQITKGQRHDFLRDTAVVFNKRAGLTGEALVEAVMRVNNSLPEPKTEEEVRAAIGNPDRVADYPTLNIPKEQEESRETYTSDTAKWPDPLDRAAFHGLAGVIVNAIAPHTEADPAGLLVSFLTIFGAQSGDAWSMHQGSWQHTNIFGALVGESSVGRKGTALSAIREVYDLVDPAWGGIIVTGIGSGEGLITYLKSHESDPRALVYESEFGRLLTSMTRESSTLSFTLRDAWDGAPIGRHVVNPKQSGTVAQHHVCALVGITGVELAEKLTSTDAANGFGNRFLWIAVRRTRLIPFTESVAGRVSPFTGSLKAALAFAQRGGVMRMTPMAQERWRAFYASAPARTGLIAALTARREPYVARLAMIYALLDQTSDIGVEHLMAAEAVWEYADRSAVYIFGDSTGNPGADSLLAMLRRESPVRWDEAKRELGIGRAADMDSVVRLLERLGLVSVVEIRKASGGRPRREIALVRA